jgi:acetyl esterase/lipase
MLLAQVKPETLDIMLRAVRKRRLAPISALWVCLALLCPFTVSGQDRLAQPIVAPLPDSTSYVVQRDLLYRERDGRRLLLDAFVPARDDGSPFPTVVFIHGGPLPTSVAEQGKDLGQYQSFAPYVTEVGLGAVVFSNGFSGLEAFQAAGEDVEAALAYVRANAEKLSLDPERICLVHMSGGGAFLAPFLESRPSWLRCVVLYYAVLRPETFEALGAGAVSVEQREDLDPFVHLEATDRPPTLFIAEAGRDAPAINADLRRFRDEAIEAGWSVEYWNHPAGPHGFDAFDPSPRSLLILERTRTFLQEQLVSY